MTDWFTAKTVSEEVLYRKALEPETIETPNGKTVVEPGNFIVQNGDGYEHEYTPEEFRKNFNTE